MTQSISQSSKGLIPFFTSERKKILDVGCGSGILINAIQAVNPAAKVVGVDINQSAVDTCVEQGLDVRHSDLKAIANMGEKFDCVIFSSVLHEFSSYDAENPFEEDSIVDAIRDSFEVLEPGGMIIIRDGIRVSDDMRDGRIRINFLNPEDSAWVERFKKDFPDYILLPDEEEGVLSTESAKEFLYTFTWGEKSWNREVQERFGILTIERWKEVLRSEGFEIKNLMVSAEEYKKFLAPKIEITDEISLLLEETTMLVVAERA